MSAAASWCLLAGLVGAVLLAVYWLREAHQARQELDRYRWATNRFRDRDEARR